MKLLAKVNADKTMIKESYRVNSGLNCIYFHNSYHTLKIKPRPVRDLGFAMKSDMIIINLITYKIYKYLINQPSIKVKIPSFYGSGCS